jgi:hypothetical protein
MLDAGKDLGPIQEVDEQPTSSGVPRSAQKAQRRCVELATPRL